MPFNKSLSKTSRPRRKHSRPDRNRTTFVITVIMDQMMQCYYNSSPRTHNDEGDAMMMMEKRPAFRNNRFLNVILRFRRVNEMFSVAGRY